MHLLYNSAFAKRLVSIHGFFGSWIIFQHQTLSDLQVFPQMEWFGYITLKFSEWGRKNLCHFSFWEKILPLFSISQLEWNVIYTIFSLSQQPARALTGLNLTRRFALQKRMLLIWGYFTGSVTSFCLCAADCTACFQKETGDFRARPVQGAGADLCQAAAEGAPATPQASPHLQRPPHLQE